MSTREASLYGTFGDLSRFYAVARKQYPPPVINYVCSTIPVGGRVLDLGCGTGNGTRPIAERGFLVVGTDIDPKMLRAARRAPHNQIRYFNQAAERLRFADCSFDGATSFGAFHWFANPQALAQIRRVLVAEAAFNVINKNDQGLFRDDFLEIIEQVLGHQVADIKEGYNPEQVLVGAGFRQIQVARFVTTDYFSFNDVLAQYQSMSHWNLPELDRPQALALLKEHARSKLVSGFIEREMEIVVVSGRK